MKNILKLALIGLPGLFSFVTLPTPTFQPGDQLAAGYYVVVAAYHEGQDGYAKKFADKINEGGLHASFGLDANRKLIYVYLEQYSDFKESLREMEKTRHSGTFSDAWVRVMKGVESGVAQQTEVEKKNIEKPVEEKKDR